ncbi:MAG TPA: molybdopterin oxidoreductase family protein [Acidimicrobiales bacterium]|nr:molybdopterin oxidoreductase family protein [Acidimicrobiales bacterium]
MARPPLDEAALVERFGPHRNDAPPDGWRATVPVEREVRTHCCFCGQQCGIVLKVGGGRVVGFEPRYDFPFNEGKLCPKGVKRYLQDNHPDRLQGPLLRTERGFVPASWDDALGRTVDELRRIQAAHGPDAVAVYGGASLTTEKAYLLGKLARLGLGTRHIDYNGRLCMVSAGVGYKKAFGLDRAPNPWADIPHADVVFVIGANIAECAPITTSYIWRARDRGARLIVADPRVTPIARTADLFLGLRPGTDSALLSAMLYHLVEQDLVDHDFVAAHTEGWEAAVEALAGQSPSWAAAITGVPAARIEEAAEMWAAGATGMLLHARGLEHQSKGVVNVSAAINLALACGRIGRQGCGPNMITGQGNGQGGREHGQKCDQLPGGRNLADPEHRAAVSAVWGCDPDDLPQPGYSAYEIMEAIERGEIKGLVSICFNPLVSLPDTARTRAALERLEHYTVIEFFLSESARHADVVLAGSLHEEDEGVVATAEGRVVKINAAVDPPGDARRDTDIIIELGRRLGAEKYFPFTSNREVFDEMRRATAGGPVDYAGITWERLEAEDGVFWPCPSEDHPGTPRLFTDLRFPTPSGRARFVPTPWRPPAEQTDDEYPTWLTTGRVVSQYLSGEQTRRIGPLVDQYPEPLCEMHPRFAEFLGVADGDLVRVTSRRGRIELPARVTATIRPDTVFIPYHWGGRKAANQLTNPVLDPESKIPEYKVAAVRVERVGPGHAVTDARDVSLTGGTGGPDASPTEEATDR